MSKLNWSAILGTFTQDQPSWLQHSCTPGTAVSSACMTIINIEEKGLAFAKICILTVPWHSTIGPTHPLQWYSHLLQQTSQTDTLCNIIPVCWHHSTLFSSLSPFSHKCPGRGNNLHAIIGRLSGAHPPQINYLPLSNTPSLPRKVSIKTQQLSPVGTKWQE